VTSLPFLKVFLPLISLIIYVSSRKSRRFRTACTKAWNWTRSWGNSD